MDANQKYVVEIEKIVQDLTLIKNSCASASEKLGFELVEPHRLGRQFEESDSDLENMNSTLKYRNLLNTLIKFTMDVVTYSKPEKEDDCRI